MDNWRWSSSRAGDVFKAMVGACDVCEGSGHKTERGKTHSGHDFMAVRHQETCEACHGTGLAGTVTIDTQGMPDRMLSKGLKLVIDLERDDTHV